MTARYADNEAEADRLVAYAQAEGGEVLTRMLEQVLAAVDQRDAAQDRGVPMAPFSVSAAKDGDLICDFCTASEPVVYYPVEEFALHGPGGQFLSGDRFYACTRCRELVDASDWKGLRSWIGPEQFGEGHRRLLVGFKSHRQGDAVEFEPGTNPEIGR